MTSAEPSAMLALPSAGGEKPRGILTVTVLLADVAGIMLLVGLLAAFAHVRALHGPFPPKGVKIDRYLGNLVVITMLMASVTIEWAYTAVRRDQRRQATAALGITIGLGLAVINLIWWGAGRVSFGPSTSAYGTLVAALVLVLGLLIGLAIGFVTFTLFRVAGSQVTATDPDQARAAAWFWHFTVAATLAVWYAVVILR